MKLDGRRQSTNVEDRRGRTVTKAAGGIGIGGVIIYLIVSFLGGGDMADALQQMQAQMQQAPTEYAQPGTPQSAEDEALFTFAKQVLAGTEDVWDSEFKKMGRTYIPPKLVVFSDAVSSGCGDATSAVGPFYCSADQSVYIDLTFFKELRSRFGAGGDFAYAYIIAHEVGHHVQHLLGTLDEVHTQRARYGRDTKGYNQLTVRLELQADFYAGVWAHHDNKMFGSIEDGDIEEALNAASKIGDDYLQTKARGKAMPDTFTHGTSEQRSRWLKRGISTGDVRQGDTFSPDYARL
ncbi:MAG: neutral zinc metallopeptidase [Bacteroidales bacterium]|nr:neutral zinc metallopeptidase [Bacteroidales bacterium]